MANPQQIIENLRGNPKLLAAVGGTLLVAIISGFFLFGGMGGNSGNSGGASCPEGNVRNEDKALVTVPNLGSAIEIQSLLAREGIGITRIDEDGKSILALHDGSTYCQRDQALLTMVSSGLMDRNIGLESFDKGDLTASREEKRIKLSRAIQGELARVIKRIEGVNDASVHLAIPEATIFRNKEKSLSASVQLILGSGKRLGRSEIRAITNLMVGAVQGLDAKHVAISDTNGNTYNSVLNTTAELQDRITEQDQYMRNKVATQLDKLIGKGNYVVTVSTQLREANQEVMSKQFSPSKSAVSSRQRFSENLNAKSGNNTATGGPVASGISHGLATSTGSPVSTGLATKIIEAAGGQNSNSKRGYTREGEEVRYLNTETQTLRTDKAGMLESITIAVSIDEEHFPQTLNKQGVRVPMAHGDLKRLLAFSASPKVNPANVSIITTSMGQRISSMPFKGAPAANGRSLTSYKKADNSWIWWMIGSIAVFGILIGGMMLKNTLLGKKETPEAVSGATQQELQRLQSISEQQQQAILATQQQTQMLMEAQQQQLAGGGDPAMAGHLSGQQQGQQAVDLSATLHDIQQTLSNDAIDEEDIEQEIQNWIESS